MSEIITSINEAFTAVLDGYIGLSSGLKGSLIITSFLMITTTMIGLKVKKMELSDVPSGITLMTVNFVDGINDMLKGFFKVHWKIRTLFNDNIIIFSFCEYSIINWIYSTTFKYISSAWI